VMGGIFSEKKHIKEETVKGVVPPYSTVRNEKCLGKGGMNQSSIGVGIGEEKAYTG
jgi:hypothetical protein